MLHAFKKIRPLQTDDPLSHANESQSLKVPLPNLRITMLGRTITCVTISEILAAIALSYQQKKCIVIANYNIHAFNLSFQLPWFHQFLEESEIVHCDGFGIIKALRYLGLAVEDEYRVSYTDLMPALLEQCNQHAWTVFLLGTKPENIEAAIERLSQTYPKSKFLGHHGYFNKNSRESNEQIIQMINDAHPQILIVGMGMPVQEEWVKYHKDQLQVNAVLVGGAVIDRLAGAVTDCPEYLSKNGLEWVYRLFKEPQRLAARYLVGNPAFALQVLLAKFQQGTQTTKKAVWSHSISLQELLAEALPITKSEIPKKRIGEYLVELNLITEADLESALEEQLQTGQRIGRILADRGLVNQQSITELVEKLNQINQRSIIPKKRIGEYLVELNLITEEDLALALEEQLQTKERLGKILANRGLINQRSIDELVSKLNYINQNNYQDYILGNTVEFLAESIIRLETEKG